MVTDLPANGVISRRHRIIYIPVLLHPNFGWNRQRHQMGSIQGKQELLGSMANDSRYLDRRLLRGGPVLEPLRMFYWSFRMSTAGSFRSTISNAMMMHRAIPSVISSGKAIGKFSRALCMQRTITQPRQTSLSGPFVVSYIMLAFAAGFIKPCLAPLLCDQSPVTRPTIKTLKGGERVIVDPQTTVSRYLLVFYFCINVGAFVSSLKLFD